MVIPTGKHLDGKILTETLSKALTFSHWGYVGLFQNKQPTKCT